NAPFYLYGEKGHLFYKQNSPPVFRRGGRRPGWFTLHEKLQAHLKHMAQSQNSSTLLDTGSLKELANARIAIVCTEWNDKIINELVNGCERVCKDLGAAIVKKLVVPG